MNTHAFQCVVCQQYFERKEFYNHINEHPQGMQYSDAFRKLEKKVKTQIMETWTFFDESKDAGERSQLEPQLDPKKSHGMELTEEDRYLTRVSDWARKFKAFQHRKEKEKKIEQWLHMSQPLKRSSTPDAFDGNSSSVSSQTSSRVSTPNSRRNSTVSRPSTPNSRINSTLSKSSPHSKVRPSSSLGIRSPSPIVHPRRPSSSLAIKSHRRSSCSTTSMTPNSPTSPVAWRRNSATDSRSLNSSSRRPSSASLGHRIKGTNLNDLFELKNESNSLARKTCIYNFPDNIPILGATQYHNAAVFLRRDNLIFVKDKRVAYIPIPHKQDFQTLEGMKCVSNQFSYLAYGRCGDFILWNGQIGENSLLVQFNLLQNEWKVLTPIHILGVPHSILRGSGFVFIRDTNSLYITMGYKTNDEDGYTNNVYHCRFFHSSQASLGSGESLGFYSDKVGWQKILPSHPNSLPSKRAYNSTVIYKHNIIIFGGETKTRGGDIVDQNDCWLFSTISHEWKKMQTRGQVPPPCSSHSACITDQYMIVYGGSLNPATLFLLHIESLEWRCISVSSSKTHFYNILPILIPISTKSSAVELLTAHLSSKGTSLKVLTTTFVKESNQASPDKFVDSEIHETEENSKSDKSLMNDLSNTSLDSNVNLQSQPTPRSRTPKAYIFENGSLLVSTPETFLNSLKHALHAQKRKQSADKRHQKSVLQKCNLKRPHSASKIVKRSRTVVDSSQSLNDFQNSIHPKRKSFVPEVNAYLPLDYAIPMRSK